MARQRQQAIASRDAQLRVLLGQMRTVLENRRLVRECFPPLIAAWLDIRLRMTGVRIVDEMRRVEGSVTAA